MTAFPVQGRYILVFQSNFLPDLREGCLGGGRGAPLLLRVGGEGGGEARRLAGDGGHRLEVGAPGKGRRGEEQRRPRRRRQRVLGLNSIEFQQTVSTGFSTVFSLIECPVENPVDHPVEIQLN